MHVHAQSVAQSVGHEHRHGSCGHGVGGRAFQQAQSDKPFGEGHVGGVVHLGVHHVGLHDARHVVVRRQYDVVNVFLLLGEASAHGIGARVVRAVAFDGFAAGVAQQQPALLQHAVGVEIVERLAVLRHDRRERHALSLRFGDAFDGSRDLAFDDARAAHPHGRRVHLVADPEGAFHLLDLFGALLLAHLRHGEHQVHRLVVVQQRGFDAQQRRQLELGLPAVGRQVVDPAAQGDRPAQLFFELRHRERRRDARSGAHFAQRGLRSGPDDVLDGEIVAVQRLFARVGVDHADDRRHVQPEIVAERGVLPEVVGVVGIIVRRERIAREQDDAASDLRAQLVAARGIGFC